MSCAFAKYLKQKIVLEELVHISHKNFSFSFTSKGTVTV